MTLFKRFTFLLSTFKRDFIRLVLPLTMLTCVSSVQAQKEIANQDLTWLMYFGNHKLTDKVGLHTEYQWRRSGGISTWQQSLLRVGVDVKLTDPVTVTTGYAHILTWPYGEQPIANKFTEHRIWEQLILTQRSGRFYFHHRYRLEQRWLEGNGGSGTTDFTYRNRARYRFMVTLPVTKKNMGPGAFFLNFYDEPFIQFGKNFQRNYLDQNRLYAALGYQFSSKGNFQLGYLNHYIIKGDGLRAERNHTLQLGLTYNFDFQKQTE